jgi:hypothetical protein
MTNIEKLLSMSSDALAAPASVFPTALTRFAEGPELFKVLQRRNGFYAFESALHVFPLSPEVGAEIGLETWNSDSLWRSGYGTLTDGLFFFAEDVFQNQFCLSLNGVSGFDAETGKTRFVADSVENWARVVLADYEFETAYPLAKAWQAQEGPLPPTKRLAPKIPFVLGGEYAVRNFWVTDAVEGMRAKADVALQIKDLPDGARVKLNVGPKPRG